MGKISDQSYIQSNSIQNKQIQLDDKSIDGCFVSTRRAIVLAVFAIISLIVVIILMYFYGPDSNKKIIVEEITHDLEELINNSISSIPVELNIRLPNNIRPLHYKLWIHPILDEYSPKNFTFTGEVEITMACDNITNEIVLHFNDIDVPENNIFVSKHIEPKIRNLSEEYEESDSGLIEDSNSTQSEEENDTAQVSSLSPEEITETYRVKRNTNNDNRLVDNLEIANVVKSNSDHKMIIVLKDPLIIGFNYTAKLQFSGNITDKLVGLYKTSYRDLSGRQRWVVTTRFQTIFARRVFPCFDEPNYRATFDISIARKINMTALSNMPLRKSVSMADSKGWMWDNFEKSPPIATRLVGFTVCDFDNLRSNVSDDGPVLNIWAPREDLPKTLYALQVARQMLQYLEKYFQVVNPSKKIDLLVIPNFAPIALENLGLISFRRTSLILDEKSNIASKISVFTIVANQIAQQWVGNIISLKWWNDFLLFQGFAGFVAELLEQNLQPNWLRYANFPVRVTHQVFHFDSSKYAKSVETAIDYTAQIERISDSITSDKGICLFRMLNYTLTESVLREGLQDYLKKSIRDNSYEGTIWDSLTEAVARRSIMPNNLTVSNFMISWTNLKGYPYVTVERNYENNIIVVSQERFLDSSSTFNETWYIPLTYIDSSNYSFGKVWLTDKSTEIHMKADNESWVLFNVDQTGYYRVNYDKHNWYLLKTQLFMRPEMLPVSNRAQILNDAFELAKIDIIEYEIPMELTKYLISMERNYIPWMSALNVLMDLRDVINNYEYTGAYDKYLIDLVKDKFDFLRTEELAEENNNDKLLRNSIVRVACELRYEPCIIWARNLYNEWMSREDPDGDNPIPLDYRRIVQCAAIKAGDKQEWDFLWERTQSPLISPTDLRRAYLSLGCTDDNTLINRYIKLSLVKDIPVENIPLVWKSLSHPVGLNVGFRFLRINWNSVFGAYEDIYFVFESVFKEFLSHLSTKVDLDDLTAFYTQHQENLNNHATVIQESVDIIKRRIDWKDRNLKEIIDWLDKEDYPTEI